MKRSILLLSFACLLGALAVLPSQGQTFNCTGLSANRYYLHDTIRVACDTVFLLNKVTYSFYRNQLKRVNTTDPKLKELVSTQSELIKLYEKRIADMTLEYDTLRSTFNRTLGKSKSFIENSNSELTNINTSLGKAQTNILAAQDSISSVKILLKDEMGKIRREKWAWGVGGAVLGVLLTLVLK
jgi:hypothetical protein